MRDFKENKYIDSEKLLNKPSNSVKSGVSLFFHQSSSDETKIYKKIFLKLLAMRFFHQLLMPLFIRNTQFLSA